MTSCWFSTPPRPPPPPPPPAREDGRMGSTKQHARPRGLRTCKQGSSFAAARQRAGVLQ